MGELVPFRRRPDLTTADVRARQAERWLEADRAKRDQERAVDRLVFAGIMVALALMFLAAAIWAHVSAFRGMP